VIVAHREEVEPRQRPGFHHRIYPYMDEFVQYAIEREKEPTPWIVRDRSAALRGERLGEGLAVVRLWVPGDWLRVTEFDAVNGVRR
jgi:hypothetical protein